MNITAYHEPHSLLTHLVEINENGVPSIHGSSFVVESRNPQQPEDAPHDGRPILSYAPVAVNEESLEQIDGQHQPTIRGDGVNSGLY